MSNWNVCDCLYCHDEDCLKHGTWCGGVCDDYVSENEHINSGIGIHITIERLHDILTDELGYDIANRIIDKIKIEL